MKKLILPLLLLAAISMLVAVESAPSSVVGYVKYDCYPGYSYVAVPMGAASTAEALLTPYLPNVSTIYKFNSLTQGWESINYDSEFGEWVGTLPVNPADVLLLDVNTGFSFYSLGNLPAPVTYTTHTGYNYLSSPLNRADFLTAEAFADAITNIGVIFQWSNQTQAWNSINYDSEFGEWVGTIPNQIGNVYLMDSTGSVTWPPAGRSLNRTSK